MLFTIQLIIILICLFYGARKGGIALGLLGGIGLVILVFVFHLQPGKPPVDVMLVIIAVVAASATLQASGGLDVMLQIAEKLLRRNPKYVSIVAPFVTCTLTILCGTGHVVFTPFCRSSTTSPLRTTSVRNVRWRQVLSVHRWGLSPVRCRLRSCLWLRCWVMSPLMVAILSSSTCWQSPFHRR